MRLDPDCFHRAQIFALGVFGAGTAEDVAITAFGQDLLGLDLEFGGVDDLQALHFRAAGVLDLLVARHDAAAAGFARCGRRIGSLR